MALTSEQNKRLGRLLMAGVPLVIALPIAMDEDPIASATTAVEGVTRGFETLNDFIPSQIKKKAKRKASKYNRKFAKAYKKLKKAKPRSKHASLMKQAHKLAKRMK